MPPPAAAVVAVDQFVDPLAPLDELLLLHPAASTLPRTIAMTAPVLVLRTFFPPTCMTTLGQDARIVAREREGEISVKQIRTVWFVNGIGPEEEFLYRL
jgi:hypothetical protein